MPRRQPPAVKDCAKSQPFHIATAIAEQAGFQPIKPRNFFRTRKRGMIGNIVRNANEFIESQDDRPVAPLDKPRGDRKILIARRSEERRVGKESKERGWRDT